MWGFPGRGSCPPSSPSSFRSCLGWAGPTHLLSQRPTYDCLLGLEGLADLDAQHLREELSQRWDGRGPESMHSRTGPLPHTASTDPTSAQEAGTASLFYQ